MTVREGEAAADRPTSVLFGVPLPEAGGLTAGQRWTAALAVTLAALLLAFGDGSRVLLAPLTSAGISAAPSAPPTTRAPLTVPTTAVPAIGDLPPGAPVEASPLAPAGDSSTPPETASEPSPPPAAPDDGGPADPDAAPDDEGAPAACSELTAPVLATAGLCPRG